MPKFLPNCCVLGTVIFTLFTFLQIHVYVFRLIDSERKRLGIEWGFLRKLKRGSGYIFTSEQIILCIDEPFLCKRMMKLVIIMRNCCNKISEDLLSSVKKRLHFKVPCSFCGQFRRFQFIRKIHRRTYLFKQEDTAHQRPKTHAISQVRKASSRHSCCLKESKSMSKYDFANTPEQSRTIDCDAAKNTWTILTQTWCLIVKKLCIPCR